MATLTVRAVDFRSADSLVNIGPGATVTTLNQYAGNVGLSGTVTTPNIYGGRMLLLPGSTMTNQPGKPYSITFGTGSGA